MKVHVKRLFFNRYTAVTCILYILIGTLSWLLMNRVLNIYFRQTASALDVKARQELLQDIFRLDLYMTGFFYGVSLFILVGAALLAMGFLDQKSGFLRFSYPRQGNYRRCMRKEILLYALSSAAIMSILYLVVLGIGLCFNQPVVGEGKGMTTAFSFILGAQRTPPLLVARYFLNVIFMGILLPFVLTLFAIAFGFVTNKKYLCLIAPAIYWFICTFTTEFLRIDFLNIGFAFWYGGSLDSAWYLCCACTSLLFMAAISVAMIEAGLRRKERLGV